MRILEIVFLLHTRILEHVRPLSAGTGVTVFQVLPEVISAIEFYGLVALAESMNLAQMLCTGVPVCRAREFVATVTTDIGRCGKIIGRVEYGLDTCQPAA